MREFDVAIVGAGLCGSIAATILARCGHAVVVIDPNRVYPDDFRVEKFDGEQLRVLEKTGLRDAVVAASTHDRHVWVSRLGYLAEKRASDQLGFDYGHLVNTLRAEFPSSVVQIQGKVTAVANGPETQFVTISGGETLRVRLVVLASGLNNSLRSELGMERMDLVRCQSITFGFDMEPAAAPAFPFRAMTHYGEHPRFRTAYVTMFPIGARMRANFFVYRDLNDPWLRAFRDAPEEMLKAVMPRLERFTGPFRIVGPVKMRPIDLYATTNVVTPGVVLVGDAFATACPAAGTGARKALVDVERLCNGYVSRWLGSPGMDVDKIARFYADPEKVASDRKSLALAHTTKAMAIETGLVWWMRRWAQLAFTRLRWVKTATADALRRMIPARIVPMQASASSPDRRV